MRFRKSDIQRSKERGKGSGVTMRDAANFLQASRSPFVLMTRPLANKMKDFLRLKRGTFMFVGTHTNGVHAGVFFADENILLDRPGAGVVVPAEARASRERAQELFAVLGYRSLTEVRELRVQARRMHLTESIDTVCAAGGCESGDGEMVGCTCCSRFFHEPCMGPRVAVDGDEGGVQLFCGRDDCRLDTVGPVAGVRCVAEVVRARPAHAALPIATPAAEHSYPKRQRTGANPRIIDGVDMSRS